jgi:hypothetical protein
MNILEAVVRGLAAAALVVLLILVLAQMTGTGERVSPGLAGACGGLAYLLENLRAESWRER